MILRITKVDHDGYCGRDFHPSSEDEGKLVSVIGLHTDVYDVEGRWCGNSGTENILATISAAKAEISAFLSNVAPSETEVTFSRCWAVVTAEGKRLDVMDHEVELMKA